MGITQVCAKYSGQMEDPQRQLGLKFDERVVIVLDGNLGPGNDVLRTLSGCRSVVAQFLTL